MPVEDPHSERLSASDLEVLSRLDEDLGPDPYVIAPRRRSSVARPAVNAIVITLGLALLLIGLQASVQVAFGGCVLVTIGARGLARHVVDGRRAAQQGTLP